MTASPDPGPGAGEAVPSPGPRTWRIGLPPGVPIITGNNRLHYHAKNRLVRNLHEHVKAAVRGRPPITVPVNITVEYASPPRLKAKRHPLASDCITDADNIAPTGKACCDGMVKCGFLAGDTKRFVRSVSYVLADEPHPRGLLRIIVTEVAA